MNGLTNCQENALARIWMAQDSLPADLTAWNLSDDLIVLRDCGMIDMQTDMSHTLAFVQKLLPGGVSITRKFAGNERVSSTFVIPPTS